MKDESEEEREVVLVSFFILYPSYFILPKRAWGTGIEPASERFGER
jgi:hypothetical protein